MDSPAQWCADPTGRHESRYWDGWHWTEHVADSGVAGADPVAWPPPPRSAGLGLRSGTLTYIRAGAEPYPIVDGAGDLAGGLVRPMVGIGRKAMECRDTASIPWFWLSMSIRGTRVMHGESEVARIGWHGIGGLSTVDLSLDIGGRPRATLRAGAQELTDGLARLVDPAGTPLAAVSVNTRLGDPAITITRLVGIEGGLDYALLALPLALILEFEDRAAFRGSHRDVHRVGSGASGLWPGL